jgi:hypothetical protein
MRVKAIFTLKLTSSDKILKLLLFSTTLCHRLYGLIGEIILPLRGQEGTGGIWLIFGNCLHVIHLCGIVKKRPTSPLLPEPGTEVGDRGSCSWQKTCRDGSDSFQSLCFLLIQYTSPLSKKNYFNRKYKII